MPEKFASRAIFATKAIFLLHPKFPLRSLLSAYQNFFLVFLKPLKTALKVLYLILLEFVCRHDLFASKAWSRLSQRPLPIFLTLASDPGRNALLYRHWQDLPCRIYQFARFLSVKFPNRFLPIFHKFCDAAHKQNYQDQPPFQSWPLCKIYS